MFIISTNKWTIYFNGWRPRIVKTWISGLETAILKGTPEQQVEELKTRLRYTGIQNMVTDPIWVARQLENKKRKNRRKR